MNYLETYRGAAIYSVGDIDPSEGELLYKRVQAKGVLPAKENMEVDFIEEAEDQQAAIRQLRKTIDEFLDEHDLQSFENLSG